VFVNNQHGIQRRGQDFDKKLYLKWYTTKKWTYDFPEKNWTKRVVNKLWKKLLDTGNVTGGQKCEVLISQGSEATCLR